MYKYLLLLFVSFTLIKGMESEERPSKKAKTTITTPAPEYQPCSLAYLTLKFIAFHGQIPTYAEIPIDLQEELDFFGSSLSNKNHENKAIPLAEMLQNCLKNNRNKFLLDLTHDLCNLNYDFFEQKKTLCLMANNAILKPFIHPLLHSKFQNLKNRRLQKAQKYIQRHRKAFTIAVLPDVIDEREHREITHDLELFFPNQQNQKERKKALFLILEHLDGNHFNFCFNFSIEKGSWVKFRMMWNLFKKYKNVGFLIEKLKHYKPNSTCFVAKQYLLDCLLVYTTLQGNHIEINELLNQGANIENELELRESDIDKEFDDNETTFSGTPLSMAIKNNDIDTARFLISKGANVQMCLKHETSPLSVASFSACNLSMVELLIQYNVNLNDNPQYSVLHYVLKRMKMAFRDDDFQECIDCWNIVHLLLKNNIYIRRDEIDYSVRKLSRYPIFLNVLEIFTRYRPIDASHFLNSCKKSFEKAFSKNPFLLPIAIKNRCFNVARILLKNGAFPHIFDGKTVRQYFQEQEKSITEQENCSYWLLGIALECYRS